jgi:HEAT repeat protein
MIAVLDAALHDTNMPLREGALAAISSRAVGVTIVRDAATLTTWDRDHPLLAQLRTGVLAALNDPSNDVRGEAVGALASLDFDPRDPTAGLKPETEEQLVQQFYRDANGGVRARIVSGLASEVRVSAKTEKLFADALRDEFPAVRHAALDGAERIQSDVGVRMLANALNDNDGTVRLQAAIILGRFGARARPYLPALQQALSRATETGAKELIRHSIDAVR